MIPAVFHQNPYDRQQNGENKKGEYSVFSIQIPDLTCLTPGVRNALVTTIEGIFLDSFRLLSLETLNSGPHTWK